MKSLLKKFTEKYLIPIVQKKFFDHPGTKELFNNPEKLFYDQWGYAKTTKHYSNEENMHIFLHFQYSEKAKVALSVASAI